MDHYDIPIRELSPQPSISGWIMPRSTRVYILYKSFIISNVAVNIGIILLNVEYGYAISPHISWQ